ncbi:hypothetical protein ACFXKC_53485 [Streptomyces sp. NPDC059340]|uniref:hypothetical protein n=1 Tax=Streptomyces sp. NPDC059340 TaxID=3346806 RepID=UPI00367BFD26
MIQWNSPQREAARDTVDDQGGRRSRTGQLLGREPNGTFTFLGAIFETQMSTSMPCSVSLKSRTRS